VLIINELRSYGIVSRVRNDGKKKNNEVAKKIFCRLKNYLYLCTHIFLPTSEPTGIKIKNIYDQLVYFKNFHYARGRAQPASQPASQRSVAFSYTHSSFRRDKHYACSCYFFNLSCFIV
jgi:hypothetical protein